MSRTNLYVTIAAIALLTSCGKEADPFRIGSDHIGQLHSTTQVRELDSLFHNDSIVRTQPGENSLTGSRSIEVYEKGGTHLLSLTPKSTADTATIGHIQVFDERYATDKGLHLKGTFKTIKDHYEISSIQNTMSQVVVSIKDAPYYVTIDKHELPESLRFNYESAIESTQIPDEARFKYLMLDWEEVD